jgi:hypothetical protein
METVWGAPIALLGMSKLADREPGAVGLNETVKAHAAFGAKVALLQVLVATM